MASVTLTTLWLNDATDLSDYRSFPLMSALQFSTDQPGEIRRGAGGRLRLIKRTGQARAVSADLPALTRADVEWLEEHLGSLLLIRDDRGRKFYGTFLALDDDAHQYDAESDVTITLLEITHSEEV